MKTLMAFCFFAINVFFSQSTSTTLNVDTSYDVGAGVFANGFVTRQAVQSDGKIIIMGSFNSYGGVSRNSIARINSDGTLDTTFNPGSGFSMPFSPNDIKLQSDGKIVIVGQFSSYNGVSRSNILRLNADGSLDTSFNPGTGTTMTPTSIDIQSDGKIVVTINGIGTFNGTQVESVFRLKTDGTLDNTFVPSSFGGTQSIFTNITSVKVQTVSGVEKILVGGAFAYYNGIPRNNIVRLNLDGSLDTSFDSGNSVQGTIKSIGINSAGNIILLGASSSYNSNTVLGVIQLGPNGTLDTSFNSGGIGTDFSPNAMALKSDGKIVILGYFANYNGTPRKGIALINSDGTLDTSFDPGTGTNATASTVAIASDGGLLIGGSFISYNGSAAIGLLKVNTAGTLDTSFGANVSVYSLYQPAYAVKQADEKLIVSGNFNVVNGVAKNYLVRFNTDGSVDTTFNQGGAGPNGIVQTICLQSDGKIIIGGQFNTYNGTTASGIARLNADGTLDSSFTTGTGFTTMGQLSYIYSIQKLSSGKILVGGVYFYDYNGNSITNKNLIRLNADGTFDSTFNTNGVGVNSPMMIGVNAIKEQTDGKILIGGNFTSFNGTSANGFLRLNADGSVDTTFTQVWGSTAGLNPGGSVKYILIQPSDNKVIIGGTFTTYNNTSSTNLARLNTDGTLDTTFNAGSAGLIYQPILLSDGKLLVPGAFTSFNGTTINKLVRLNANGSVDTSFSPGSSGASGAFSPIGASRLSFVFEQADGNLLVVGNFNSYNGTARNIIARLIPNVTNNMATSNFSAPKFTIFPNPAKDFVNVSNISKGADVSIFDMTGKLLYSTKSTGTTLTLNTASFKNGLYLLKVDGQVSKLLISK